MTEDVRYALRQIRKSPGFAAAAIVTLALGIGAAAAMFGLIHGVLLSPPPYAAPDRLVLVSPKRVDGRPYTQGTWFAQWLLWRAESKTLDPPALYRWTFNFLVLPDGSRVARRYGRHPQLLLDLGREAAPRPRIHRGRGLAAQGPGDRHHARLRAVAAAVQRGPGDRRLVDPHQPHPAPLTVVGVMPPGIRFLPDPGNASEPNYDVDAPVDFWLAFTPDETQPRARGWNTVARLRDGATVAQAQSEVAAFAVRQGATEPDLAPASPPPSGRSPRCSTPTPAGCCSRCSARWRCSSSSPRSTSRACSWRGGCSVIASTRCVRRSARRGCGCSVRC